VASASPTRESTDTIVAPRGWGRRASTWRVTPARPAFGLDPLPRADRELGGAEHRDRLVHHAFRGEVWGKALAHLKDLDAVASPAEVGEVMGVGADNPGPLWWGGEFERAAKAAERELAIAASFGHFAGRVVASCRLAQAHLAVGDYARSATTLRQVVAALHGDLARQHFFGMASFPAVFARSYLAWCLAELGEFADGEALGAEGVAIADSADHAYSQGHVAHGLGTHYVIAERPDRAIALLERGLVVARLANIAFLFPFLGAALGAAHALARQFDRAQRLLEQAEGRRLLANRSVWLTWLGRTHLVAGRPKDAEAVGRRAIELAVTQGERGQEAHARLLMADVATVDDPDGAMTAYDDVLGMAGALGMRPVTAHAHLGLGAALRRTGAVARANTSPPRRGCMPPWA